MTDTTSFNKANIFRTPNQQYRNTELPDQAWQLPISDEYAQNIQDLLVKTEREWMKELGQQFNQLLLHEPKLAKTFAMPVSPMRYGEAVAYQIMRQDFRFLEIEAAALGFALVPINYVQFFDPTQVRMMSNGEKLMEMVEACGRREKRSL